MDLMGIRRALMSQHIFTIGGLPVIYDNAVYRNKNGTVDDFVSDPRFFITGIFDTGSSEKKSYTFTRYSAFLDGASTSFRVYNDLSATSYDYWSISAASEATRTLTTAGRYILFSVYKPMAARAYMYNNTDNVYIFRGKNLIEHPGLAKSGNNLDCSTIAHFSTSNSGVIQKLIVNLPYNANGYTNVNVTHTGVNLLQCINSIDGINKNVTYTAYRNSDGEVERVHILGTANADNAFRNLNHNGTEPSLLWPPDGSYATYAYSTSATICFIGNKTASPSDRNNVATGGTVGDWKIYDLTHNPVNTIEWVRIQLMPGNCNGTAYDDDLYPLICLASDQGCTFEPYKGRKYTTSFQQIYGGTVDLVNGKVIGRYAADGSETMLTEQTIAPQTINTLIGVNNIWSDIGTVTVKYQIS